MISVQQFTLQELQVATNDFSESHVVGRGGFGTVYIGYVRGSTVAVKCLNEEGKRQLKPELATLTK